MNEQQVLDILTAIHAFCSSITKAQFVTYIGHETTWDKITREHYHPDIFDLLSYGDVETRVNLAKWLIARSEVIKAYENEVNNDV